MQKTTYLIIVFFLILLSGCSKNPTVPKNSIQTKSLQKEDLINIHLKEKVFEDIINIESIPSLEYVSKVNYKNNTFKQGLNYYDFVGKNENYIVLYKGKEITIINKKTDQINYLKRYTKKIKIFKNKVFYIVGNNVKILDLVTKKETDGIGNLYLSTEDIIYPINEGGNIENILNFIQYLKQKYTNEEIGKIISKLIGKTYCEEVIQLTKKYSLFTIKTKKYDHTIANIIAHKCDTSITSMNILKISDDKYLATDLIIGGSLYDNIITRNNGAEFNLYTHLDAQDTKYIKILAYVNSKFLLGVGSITTQDNSTYPKYVPVMINIENGVLNAYYDFHQINIGKYTYIYNDQGIELILNQGLD